MLRNVLFNIVLDIRRVQHATALGSLDHFHHQLLVSDGLAALHNPHNRCLRLVFPIRLHPLVSRLVLLFRLLELDLVDLDTHLGVREFDVERKCVTVADFLALWILGYDTVLCAGEGLQSAFQFSVR